MIQTFNCPDVVYIHSKAIWLEISIFESTIKVHNLLAIFQVFFSLCRKILRRLCKFMLICIQKSGTGRVSYWACWSREENMTWARTKGSLWTGPEDSATDTRWGRFRRYICIYTFKSNFIRCILGCFLNSIENIQTKHVKKNCKTNS